MKSIYFSFDPLTHFALLLCFWHSFGVIALISGLPDAMGTNGCAKSLLNYYFFF